MSKLNKNYVRVTIDVVGDYTDISRGNPHGGQEILATKTDTILLGDRVNEHEVAKLSGHLLEKAVENAAWQLHLLNIDCE